MLEAKNISCRFNGRSALSGVSFDVAPGEVVGLLGANGAGKTTLLRVLAAYLEPEAGVVTYNNRDIFTNKTAFYKTLGYLPERCPLYAAMRVDRYLTFRGLLKGLSRHRTARRLRDVAAICGVKEVLTQTIASLSQGYRRRVGLADTLLAQPKLLLLDDPFAGVDHAHAYALRQAVAAASVRAAVVISGHDAATMVEICNRFLVLRQGQLVFARRVTESTHNKLLHALSLACAGTGDTQSFKESTP